ATPADTAAFRTAAAGAYGEALGLTPVPGRLSAGERRRVSDLDVRFTTNAWLDGPARPEPACATVKVRSRVWVCDAEHDGARAVAAVIRDRIDRIRITDPELNHLGDTPYPGGEAAAVEARLAGLTLSDAAATLDHLGPPGRRLATALAKARMAG
ncbi:MAG: hypothetical protein ACRDZ7_11415, partial [Acidimicrobiia bacterium]